LFNTFLEACHASCDVRRTGTSRFRGNCQSFVWAKRDSSRRIDIPSGGDIRLIGRLNSLPVDWICPISRQSLADYRCRRSGNACRYVI